MKLAKRITHWRNAAGLSQAEIARALDISPAAVAQWELDESTPSTKNLCALAEACGVTMSKFWGPIAEKRAS